MDAGVKERWVAALRSGEYGQTTGALRNSSGYCCLGVLCDIHDKEYTHSNWLAELDEENQTDWHYGNTNIVLPRFVMEWADLEDNNPHANGQSLAQMNDRSESFEYIADQIEAYL